MNTQNPIPRRTPHTTPNNGVRHLNFDLPGGGSPGNTGGALAPSPRHHPIPDALIERWGEIFVKNNFRESLGVDFERFIKTPRLFIRHPKLPALIQRIESGMSTEGDAEKILEMLGGRE